MHEDVRNALREAMLNARPMLESLASRYREPYLVWRRSSEGSWQGEYRDGPDFRVIFDVGRGALETIGARFVELFRRYYPEYEGRARFPSFGVRIDPSQILGTALREVWRRHSTFDVDDKSVDVIVRQFEEFVDLPTTRLRYSAELVNYHMDRQQIQLPGDMVIRQLTEAEVSETHGGPTWRLDLPANRAFLGPEDCVLEGEYEEPKVFGDEPATDSQANSLVRPNLDRVVLALRTFKEGRVGYDLVRFRSVKFCPLPLPLLIFGDLYIPLGLYHLSEEEVEPLQQHIASLLSELDPAMKMACARLADAQMRLRPHDRLVDAVIGLEALLLAGLPEGDRRGELKHRFALNYSTLFASPEERHRAFRTAKDLYDLRSTIAHGGMPREDRCRVGDKSLSLDQAAGHACEVLRGVVLQFLKYPKPAPYKDPSFWEKGYFGLRSET